MDTSNAADRVAYALSGHELSTLMPDEWLQVLKEALRRIKPYIKYLPAFTDHNSALHYIDKTCECRRAAGGGGDHLLPVSYPEARRDLRPTTRLLPLVALSPWAYTERTVKLPWEDDCITETFLLVSTKLKWVLCERVAERYFVEGGHERQQTKSIALSLLNEAELLDRIGDRPYRWHRALRSISSLIFGAIYAKQQHIKKMKKAHTDLAAIAGRIKSPHAN